MQAYMHGTHTDTEGETMLVDWNCPSCEAENSDIPNATTHCTECGEVVFVLDDGSVDDQHWKVEWEV